MPTFPILSTFPVDRDFMEGPAYDPSIRSQQDDGLIISRGRFTSIKKKFTMTFNNLNEADKVLLDDFQETVKVGGDTFTWTNPKDDVVYTVRFETPIELRMNNARVTHWSATFTLIEA